MFLQIVELCLLLALCGAAQASSTMPTLTTPSGIALKLELATTPEQRELGLMFRDSLPADRGMLFLFKECEERSFWMKNCFITLDIVWMNANGKVLAVMPHLPPCREDPCPNYDPGVKSCYVLEIGDGQAEKLGIKKGVKLDLKGVLKNVRIY